MQANRTLMRWIVNSSLRFRFLVVAAAVAMMAVGTLMMPDMRVDAFPEFAPPQVVIQTTCLGLSTTDVESLVTIPLEQALMGIKGLEHMRSRSVPQLSSVQMIFSQDTDLFEARQLVQERLPNIQKTLPSWARTSSETRWGTTPGSSGSIGTTLMNAALGPCAPAAGAHRHTNDSATA